MTTIIAQTEEKPSQRAPLPPVEVDAAPLRMVEEHVGTPMEMSALAPQERTMALEPAQQKEPATGVAGWLSRNRWFTKEPVTNIGYQFARSSLATIPYGFGMAAIHHVFGLMSAKGQKMGLTEEGIKAFQTRGPAAMSSVAEAERAALYSTEKHALLGRNMMRLGNSPLNAAIQIGLGFTMFRFVGGVVKNLRDRVMNEKNTPEQTVAEVKNAGKTIADTAKINWPAESTGTPIAALVLGFMSAAYTPTTVKPIRDMAKYPGLKGFATQAKEVVFSKPAKLMQNAAVWTLSYSLFFLMAESLFKDVQLKRGLWKGHPNSLKNGPDDTVGGPGAIKYTPPEQRKAEEKAASEAVLFGSAEEGYKTQPIEDDRARDSHEKLRYPWLTGEPSIGRFLIRRVAPVAVGITAYAALKRVGYLADVPVGKLKGVNGPMEVISAGKLDELKTVGDHTKFFLKNAYREGKATAMFGALWVATDAWGATYDKFVHYLQRPENKVELNQHQQGKHAELLGRVNDKLQAQGRAA